MILNYIYVFLWENKTIVGGRASMSSYFPVFHKDVNTAPYPNRSTDLADLCYYNRPTWPLLQTWINFNPSMDK